MKKDNILELFQKISSKCSQSIAIERGEEKISYGELTSHINALAIKLSQAGVRKGDQVVILSNDSVHVIVSMLAIWNLGGVFIPQLPNENPARLNLILKEVCPKCILIDNLETYELQLIIGDGCTQSIVINLKDNKKQVNQLSEITKFHASSLLAPDDMCYIYFTSGSTGRPKGIMGRYKSVVHFIEWEINTFGLKEEVRVSQLIVPVFDAFLRDTLVPLCVGGTVCIPETREQLLDGNKLVSWIDQSQINLIHCVPSLFRLILNSNLSPSQFPALKYILLSGEPLLPADIKRWMEHFNDRIQLVNLYGSSETTMIKFFYLVKSDDQNRPTIPIGQPMSGAAAIIVNEKGNVCTTGEIGEIYVRTPYRSLGYFNQPELTNEVFIKNPFNSDPDDIIYKSGDFGRLLESGDFEYLGRKDQQVKIRGIRIELDEINSLLRLHEGVEDVAVIDAKDTLGNNYLCAYVVVNRTINNQELSHYLLKILPEYMVPSVFIIMDSLPRGMTGKLDRRSLPKPEYQNMNSGREIVRPRNPLEEILERIWSNVLGLKRVGINDNFFQLGGHSLLAMQLILKIREELQLELPLRALFRSPTILEFCQEVLNARDEKQEIFLSSIEQIDRKGEIPLSFAQERLWFLNQFEFESGQYNIVAGVKIEGLIDLNILKKVFQKLIMRHESLRTIFVEIDGIPRQNIGTQPQFIYKIVDLKANNLKSESEKFEELSHLAQEEAGRGFDLTNGPLLRVNVFCLREDLHVFVMTVHHIIADGWSMGIFIKELSSLYLAEQKGEELTLPKMLVQYADFAAWQRKWLSGDLLEKKLTFWKELLAGHSGILELPTDYKRPLSQSFRGGAVKINISNSVKSQLDVINYQEGTTLFMALMSGFSALLERWSGSKDLLIGFPVANRDRLEIENLIGLFANTLVLRVKNKKNLSFRSLLQQVKASILDIYMHQDVPFEKLVNELKITRDFSRNPLFQVMLILQNINQQEYKLLNNVKLTPYEIKNNNSKFDLTLNLFESSEGIQGVFEFNADLFEVETIERMARSFEVLLEKVVVNPDVPVSQLQILSPNEHHKLIFDWNATKKVYPEVSVIELFENQVKQSPNSTAIEFQNKKIPYSELNKRSNQLAHKLRSMGVGLGSLVGICMERSIELVVAMLGVLKAGATYIPLDPSYPKERLAFMIDDAALKFLVCHLKVKEKIESYHGENVWLDDSFTQLEENSGENLENGINLNHLAYVIYTSGSTGRPKGVQVTHRGLSNFLFAMGEELNWTGKDNILAITTFSFDIAGLELYLPLTKGGRIEILGHEIVSNGQLLFEKLKSSEVSFMQATSTTWQMLFTAGWKGEGVSKILCGGEVLSNELAQALLMDQKRLWNLYGPTETTIWSTIKEIKKDVPVNIGRPIANTQVYILDEGLNPVPIGTPGIIYIGGNGLARGYLNRSDLTAEKFIPNPFSEDQNSRIYNTGDLACYKQDGTIDFLGRVDQQVKIRGYRIETEEIEVVLRKYPGIEEAIVVARQDPSGNVRLEAYLLTNKKPVDLNHLRSFLVERLPIYMVPAVFELLDALPLTPNGKIDRATLHISKDSIRSSTDKNISFRNSTEEMLISIFSQLLNLENINIYDNFFEVGGHSLLATQLISRIEKQFGVRLSLHTLFQKPNIASISDHLLTMSKICEEVLYDSGESSEDREIVFF